MLVHARWLIGEASCSVNVATVELQRPYQGLTKHRHVASVSDVLAGCVKQCDRTMHHDAHASGGYGPGGDISTSGDTLTAVAATSLAATDASLAPR